MLMNSFMIMVNMHIFYVKYFFKKLYPVLKKNLGGSPISPTHKKGNSNNGLDHYYKVNISEKCQHGHELLDT